MTTTPSSAFSGRRRRRAGAATATGLAALALALAACGGGSGASPTSTTTAHGAASGRAGAGGRTPRAFPGTTGTLAAIDGTTLEVQGSSSQTSVTYTSSTAFSQETTGSLASVTVGSCITASGSPGSSGSRSSTSSTSAGSRALATKVTATTVRVSAPDSTGACTNGFGPGGGVGGSRPPGTGSGAPPASGFGGGKGRPSGRGGTGSFPRRGSGVGRFSFAFGSVTAVSGNTVTVSETTPRSKAATTVTVTVSGSTTYSVEAPASAANLAVGQCVAAAGPAATNGAITAASIRLSAPTGGNCSTGFAGRFEPGAPGGGSGA